MLNITITEQTPNNMLRAIRAACNELLGDTTAELVAPKAAEQETLAAAFDKTVESVGAPAVAQALLAQQAEDPLAPTVWAQGLNEPPMGQPQADAHETDSTGAEWNPELHASTKAKNQDGTWKKRRGAGKETDAVQDMGKDLLELSKEQNPQVARDLPPLPPTPPAPATPLVTMNDIYALITNGKAVLNDVIAGAQAMGFADVGAFSRDATPEQRAQLLAQLTTGVA